MRIYPHILLPLLPELLPLLKEEYERSEHRHFGRHGAPEPQGLALSEKIQTEIACHADEIYPEEGGQPYILVLSHDKSGIRNDMHSGLRLHLIGRLCGIKQSVAEVAVDLYAGLGIEGRIVLLGLGELLGLPVGKPL